MSAFYDLYQHGDSWMHRLDARVKLLLAVCGCGLLLLYDSLWIMAGGLIAVHLALLSAHIGGRKIIWVWKMALPTMLMVALLWVVFHRGEGRVLLRAWFVEVTARSLAQGLAAALRIGALSFAIFAWLFTTSQTALVRSLIWLGLPYEWGLTISMALRYLPTMGALFGTISDAQQARALDLTGRNPLRKARAYIPIVVAMLITAFRMAENLSRALESRALGTARRRTHLHPLRFRAVDGAWAVGTVLCTAALLWARYALNLGADPFWLLP